MKRLEFKRLNFFKGLFTKADDWKQEQNYHIEKHKLHNRCFHSPGIVRGANEELGVIVTEDGSIKVRPGCAVDGHGNELYLTHTHDLLLPELNHRREEHMEVLHYIFIEYHQEYSEERENYQNPNFSGPAFVVERPSVGWTTVAPDNNSQIELARIGLKPGRRVTQKEINTKHVRYAESKWPGRIVFDIETRLNANPPSEGVLDFDQKATRQRFAYFPNPNEAAGTFYLANVYPIDFDKTANARIMWRIEASITENAGLGYFLVMKNFGKTDVMVRCEVLQMNLAWDYGATRQQPRPPQAPQ
jgi:hypothetical protein